MQYSFVDAVVAIIFPKFVIVMARVFRQVDVGGAEHFVIDLRIDFYVADIAFSDAIERGVGVLRRAYANFYRIVISEHSQKNNVGVELHGEPHGIVDFRV